MHILTTMPAGKRAVLISLALLATSALAQLSRQAHLHPVHASRIELTTLVPLRFGAWRLDPALRPMPVSVDAASKTAGSYAQTLERIYVDGNGHRVMLSIAYGDNVLGDRLQVHRPEFCYQAQGFGIQAAQDTMLDSSWGPIPVRRLQAYRPGRQETISYWLTVGNQALLPGLSRKLAQIRYGLSGFIPDGMLVRISSVDMPVPFAQALHDSFINDLLSALPQSGRLRLGARDTALSIE